MRTVHLTGSLWALEALVILTAGGSLSCVSGYARANMVSRTASKSYSVPHKAPESYPVLGPQKVPESYSFPPVAPTSPPVSSVACDLANPTHVCCFLNNDNKPAYKPATALCRPACDLCDKEEYCTGSSPVCPQENKVRPAGEVCGTSSRINKCEGPRVCDGKSVQCAATGMPMSAGTICRASRDICEDHQYCDGKTLGCPAANTYLPAGTICGDAKGECEDNPTCTGHSHVCSAAKVIPVKTKICRKRNGICDAPEWCDGINAKCPSDKNVATHPDYSKSPTICRKAHRVCELDTVCTEHSNNCGDAKHYPLKPADTPCFPSFGACDLPDTCGLDGSCPDNRADKATVCRWRAGLCDKQDTCASSPAGNAYECGLDRLEPKGKVCLLAATALLVPDKCAEDSKCNGESPLCPLAASCSTITFSSRPTSQSSYKDDDLVVLEELQDQADLAPPDISTLGFAENLLEEGFGVLNSNDPILEEELPQQRMRRQAAGRKSPDILYTGSS